MNETKKNNWFEIVKYKPWKYDENGHYTTDEWTMVWEIGQFLDGHKVTINEYLETENNYIKAALEIVNHEGIDFLWLRNFALYSDYSRINTGYIRKSNQDNIKFVKTLRKNSRIGLKRLPQMLMAMLRHNIWFGYLRYPPKNFTIKISEFYMYVQTNLSKEEIVEIATRHNLYVDARYKD